MSAMLVELQRDIRAALLTGNASAVVPMLRGGNDPSKRLAIHQRHYRASLVEALLARFPATIWLVGSDLVRSAAQSFVQQHPPSKPCIAEYGEEFPEYLGARPGTSDLLYLADFVRLEWHVARAALAVEYPALTLSDLARIGPAGLEQSQLALQPGIDYVPLRWNVDELLLAFLSGQPPERFNIEAGDFWIELRGRRGDVTMARLTHAMFAYRAAIAGGQPIGDAAVAALEIDEEFDLGDALISLTAEGLVVEVNDTGDAHA